jgi:uncharacterized membrane protein YedE/YeeE
MHDSVSPDLFPDIRVGVGVPRWAALGALLGLVSTAAIALYGPIGVSGAYARLIGAALERVAPTLAAASPGVPHRAELVAPEIMLVLGLVVGGFLAARLGRPRAHAPAVEFVHANEQTSARRYGNAFAGGFLFLFGARIAGGCTSGHVISGITQLAVSGLLFGAAVFASGIPTARWLGGRALR